MPKPNGPREDGAIGRRDFLSAIGFWAATAVSMLLLAIPAVRFAAGKALDPQPVQWVPLGAPEKLPTGDFVSVAYQIRAKDAWREVKKAGLIYVQAAPASDDGYLALSAFCSHLGCNVRWVKEASHFACPCHQGIYDAKGDVVSGPPPRPLRELETRINESGVLEARL
jgi:Rieske Fe-S protein